MQAGEINIKFKVDSAGAITGIQQVSGALDRSVESTSGLNKEMINLAAAFTALNQGVAIASQAVDQFIIKPGQLADQIKDLSYQTNLSTEAIQKLQYAAILSGAEFPVITNGLQQLTLSMAEAKDAASGAAQAFVQLGVSPAGKSTEVVFKETASALSAMADETERNRIAMELYGRSWKEMLPFMEDYIANAKEIEAHPFLNDAQLDRLERGKTAFEKLNEQLNYLFFTILAEAQARPAGWDFLFPPADEVKKLTDVMDDYNITVDQLNAAVAKGNALAAANAKAGSTTAPVTTTTQAAATEAAIAPMGFNSGADISLWGLKSVGELSGYFASLESQRAEIAGKKDVIYGKLAGYQSDIKSYQQNPWGTLRSTYDAAMAAAAPLYDQLAALDAQYASLSNTMAGVSNAMQAFGVGGQTINLVVDGEVLASAVARTVNNNIGSGL